MSARLVRWSALDEPEDTPEPFRISWAVEAPLEPRAILGRVELVMTADLEHGLAHFVTLAVLREASA